MYGLCETLAALGVEEKGIRGRALVGRAVMRLYVMICIAMLDVGDHLS